MNKKSGAKVHYLINMLFKMEIDINVFYYCPYLFY